MCVGLIRGSSQRGLDQIKRSTAPRDLGWTHRRVEVVLKVEQVQLLQVDERLE